MDTRRRLSALLVLTATLFGTLFARIAWLQVVQGAGFRAEAESNTKTTVYVPATRGRIKDRNGEILVDNKIVSVVKVTLSKAGGKDSRYALSQRLSPVIGIDPAEVRRRWNAIQAVDGVEVARNITKSAEIYLRENAEDFPGVTTELQAQRVYPQGNLAPHVLGYVSDIGGSLTDPPCNAWYQPGDKIGKAGVEASYECVLRGVPGIREYTVNRRGQILPEFTRWLAKPVNGADVQLTIDPSVQVLATKSLGQGMRAARRNKGEIFVGRRVTPTFFPAPAGAVVVLDSQNSSVVAMASLPEYDPRDFIAGLSDQEYKKRYVDATTASPLTNRAISGLYSPGSTVKPFVAVSAYNYGLINRTTTIEDPGFFIVPGCDYKKVTSCRKFNAGKTPHGKVDLRKSLVVSSDTYYYWIGQMFWEEQPKTGREGMQATYREFGFGGDTGIALPNEQSGDVPDEAWQKERYEQGWSTGDNMNVAIGQGGFNATPLQIANAYAALANNGKLYVPRIAFDTEPPPVASTTLVAPESPTSSIPVSSTPAVSLPNSSTSIPPTTLAELADDLRSPFAQRFGAGRFGVSVDSPGPSTSIVTDEEDLGLEESESESGSGSESDFTSESGASEEGLDPTRLEVLPEGVTLNPTLRRSVDLSSDVRGPIVSGLSGVINEDNGTASKAFSGFSHPGFPVAGKTGTAQRAKKHDYALFVGFGGANNRFVVCVIIEEAGFGGAVAAPVARRIFDGLAGIEGAEVDYINTGPQDR